MNPIAERKASAKRRRLPPQLPPFHGARGILRLTDALAANVVEQALAKALESASAAGRFDVVAQLARGLEASIGVE